MNIVCISGEVARERRDLATSVPVGWTSVVLDVQREEDDAPGVVPVVLALPPSVVAEDDLQAFWPGRPILVIGKLEVEVDYASAGPAAYQSVVAHRIEFIPSGSGAFSVLTPRLRLP